jgi:hypothetical protein
MADREMTPEEQRLENDLLRSLETNRDLTLREQDAILDLVKSLRKYGIDMGAGTKTLNYLKDDFGRLDKSLQSGRRSLTDISEELVALTEELESVADSTEKRELEKQIREKAAQASRAQATKFLVDSLEVAGKAFINYGLRVYKSILSNYQSNASVFQATGDIAIAEIDRNVEMVQGVAKTYSQLSGEMALLSAASKKAGSGLWALSGAVAEGISIIYSTAKDWEKFTIQAVVKEMEGAVKSMHDLSSAGAFFAGGLQEIRVNAREAFLDQTQFAKAITDNADELRAYGGTVTNGIKEFVRVNKSIDQFRGGLINAGYTIEGIADGTAMYLGMLGRIGAIQQKSAEDRARDTAEYLLNIKAISAFTGEDVKKAQARADKAAANSAIRAKLIEESTHNGVVNQAEFIQRIEAFEAMIKNVDPAQQLAVMQQRAFGVITDRAFNQAAVAEPAMRDYVVQAVEISKDFTNKKAVSGEAYQELYKQIAPAFMKSLQGFAQGYGTAFLATGQFGDINEQFNAFFGKVLQAEKIVDTTYEEIKKGAAADDKTKAAEQIIEGQRRRLQIMEKLDGGLANFASVMAETNKKIKNYLTAAESKWGKIALNTVMPGNTGPSKTETKKSSAGPGLPNSNALTPGKISPGAVSQMIASTANYGTNNIKGNLNLADLGVKKTNLEEYTVGELVKLLNEKGIYSGGSIGSYGLSAEILAGADPNIKLTREQQLALNNLWVSKLPGWNDYKKGVPGAKDQFLKNLGNQAPGIFPRGPDDNTAKLKWSDIYPKFEKGGIARSTSIAGETGPEAIIPLSGGNNIPLVLDFSELISKLNSAISAVENHNNLAERLVHAQA